MSFVTPADAATACMNAKFHFWAWRPFTAIRNADTDGNPNTIADPSREPLDVTPGHPEYPANHGCVTQALSGMHFRHSVAKLIQTCPTESFQVVLPFGIVFGRYVARDPRQ
jgi:hypothetical protein